MNAVLFLFVIIVTVITLRLHNFLWGFSASVGADSYPIAGLRDRNCIFEHESAHLAAEGYDLYDQYQARSDRDPSRCEML